MCQYTNTLCTTQKQTHLTNSLLQKITVFNEYESTKLEDWLMDIETAADLTDESWAKLEKAESRGLSHTLVMEAINSDKSWEENKGFIKNTNCAMLTYISIPHISWTANNGKRNPLQPTSTGSKLKQRDVILQMMLPPLGFLYND